MKATIATIGSVLLMLAILELWQAVRPDDLDSQIRAWLSSPRGEFEQWQAERERHARD